MMQLVTVLPVVILTLWLVPVFPLLYVITRWRSGGRGEPGLGSFGLVLYFRSAAILVAVAALAVLTYRVLSEEDSKSAEDITRAAIGILTASAIFLAVHLPLGGMLVPEGDTTTVSRVFTGFLMAVAGTIVFVALVWYFALVFQRVPEMEAAKESHSDMMRMAGSWLLWFGALYGYLAYRMRP